MRHLLTVPGRYADMNETEKYISNQIRLSVWSGFASPDDVQQIVSDLLEGDVDEAKMREIVSQEFESKAKAQASWPEVTDVDKLDMAFDTLNSKGVISIHRAGWDKSEAFHNCLDHYREAGSPQELFGICFYAAQDVESAIEGAGLFLGYSSTRPEDEETDALKAANLICEELKEVGLTVNWGGDTSSRINVDLKWQMRT